MGAELGKLRAALAAVLLAASAALGAQASAAKAISSPGPNSSIDFRYDVGEDGQPVFTQVLHWEGDDNALEYAVIIKDEAGAELVNEKSTEAMKEVRLSPGSYRYKIITYNLLGKAEGETEWLELRVIKAEQPRVASTSPAVIYMDSLDGRVTVKGEKLIPGARVFMKAKDSPDAGFEGRELQRKGEEEIVVSFPDDAYQGGIYGISVENPGGLRSGVDDALRIKFQRPLDILVYAGYSPFIDLGDTWFATNWPDAFDPLGFEAGLQIYFIKAKWGFVGVEGQAQFRRLLGGEPAATITSDYLLAGANAVYKYRFSRRFHALARLGGGLAFSRHSFDYDGFAGPKTNSTDPFARFGVAAQYFTPIKLFGELGVDWSSISLKGHFSGGFTPSLSLGYQVY